MLHNITSLKPFTLPRVLLASTLLIFSHTTLSAVEFNTNDNGIYKGMNYWGIGWVGNVEKNIERMGGENNIDVVRIGCPKEWALDNNNQLVADAKAEVDKQIKTLLRVRQVNSNAQVAIVCSGGNGINNYYIQRNGEDLRGERWLAMFKAVKNYLFTQYNISTSYIEVANEQDFNKKIGTPNNIHKVQERFSRDSELSTIPLVGPSTLSCNAAIKWYEPARNSTDWGATHTIGGNGDSYLNFVKTVRNDGKPYYGSEIHNLVEMIIAEEYGGLGGLWWNTASKEEGLFSQYSQQGNRIFYREKMSSFSATSGYKGNNNTIHIFAASVKGGATFDYVSNDRPVYWNGKGPQRSFSISLAQGESRYIEVTMNSTAPPNDPDANNGGENSNAFGLEYRNNSTGIVYHEDNGWSAGFAYLCLNSNCATANKINGRFEAEFSGLSAGNAYSIEFKVQDNALGQCVSGTQSVVFQSNGDTASSACD